MAKLNKTPLTIRAKRGAEAEITSYTGYQLSGEIAYATDTEAFFVSNGTTFVPVGGGTLQSVTDAGNTTTNSIGIGLTNPQQKLHVGGVLMAQNIGGTYQRSIGLFPGNYEQVIKYSGNGLVIQNSSNDDTLGAGGGNVVVKLSPYATNDRTTTLSLGNKNQQSLVHTSANGLLTINSATSGSVMSITSSGNVGIGTTTPAAKLEVGGSKTIPIEGYNEPAYISINPTITDNNSNNNSKQEFLKIAPNYTFNYGSSNVPGARKASISITPNYKGIAGYNNDANGVYALYSKPTFDSNIRGVSHYGIYLDNPTYNNFGSNRSYYPIYVAEGTSYFGGNVGIGTTAPTEKLQVLNSVMIGERGFASFSDGRLRVASTTDYGEIGFSSKYDNFPAGIRSYAVDALYERDLRFYTKDTISAADGNLRMIITGGGNVGIGTTAPASKLEVHQSADSQGLKIVGFDDENDSNLHLFVDNFGNNKIFSTEFLEISAGGSSRYRTAGYLRLEVGGTNNQMQLDHNYMKFTSGGTETMRITPGNVGIGTTAPAYSLEIHKSGNAFRVANDGGYATFTVNPSATVPTSILGRAQAYSSLVSANNFEILNGLLVQGYKAGGAHNAVRARAISVEYGMDFNSAGILDYASGVYSRFTTRSAGSGIDNAYGFYSTADNPGGTSVTNQYGLYIADTAIATNNYGVYQAGTSFKNIFEGNVGIGTTAPTLPLDVVANEVKFSGSGNMNFYTTPGVSSHFNFYNVRQNSDYIFKQNVGGAVGTPTVIFKGDTGNVGINTTAPTEKLQVSGGNILLDTNTWIGGGGGSGQPRLRFDNTNSQGKLQQADLVLNDEKSIAWSNTGTGIQGRGVDNQRIEFNVASSERMRITSAGNVGIGTTSPAAKLHVAGEIRVNAGQPVMLDVANNIYAVAAQNQFRLYSGGSPAINVTTSGNVGIGTTAPNSKVHISGTAMQQLRMETAGGPSSSGDTSGRIGDMAYDDDFFYIKTANGWGRVQLDFGF